MDLHKNEYVGIDGKSMHNYTDSNGKQHGRNKADFNAVTHFRIKKREDMQIESLFFTHELLVPRDASTISNADGYFEEIAGAQVYTLSQSEYDLLRKVGGLFEIFDRQFGTIIDDCEEDQISADDVTAAIQEAEKLCKQSSDPAEKKQ